MEAREESGGGEQAERDERVKVGRADLSSLHSHDPHRRRDDSFGRYYFGSRYARQDPVSICSSTLSRHEVSSSDLHAFLSFLFAASLDSPVSPFTKLDDLNPSSGCSSLNEFVSSSPDLYDRFED